MWKGKRMWGAGGEVRVSGWGESRGEVWRGREDILFVCCCGDNNCDLYYVVIKMMMILYVLFEIINEIIFIIRLIL